MDFCDLIKPLSLDEWLEKVKASESVLMPGNGKRDFSELVSLAEIETTLNNGCNTSDPIQIISDGLRKYLIDKDVNWSPFAIKKSEITHLLKSGHSFIMMNMSQINEAIAGMIDTIEKEIEHSCADLHLYISPTNDATGYEAHRDRPQHKIYLQVIGDTSWQIFSHTEDLPNINSLSEEDENKYLTQIMDFTMEPGDVLYMPPGQFHKVRNHNGPRISFSIPIIIDPKDKRQNMDRSHIPFKALFEDALRVDK